MYKAIGFYLDHQEEVRRILEENDRDPDEQQELVDQLIPRSNPRLDSEMGRCQQNRGLLDGGGTGR